MSERKCVGRSLTQQWQKQEGWKVKEEEEKNERRKKKKLIKIEKDTATRIKTTFYQMKIDDRAQTSDVPWEMVTLFNTFFIFSPLLLFSLFSPYSNGV